MEFVWQYLPHDILLNLKEKKTYAANIIIPYFLMQ